MNTEQAKKEFLFSINGKRLLGLYTLNEYGCWQLTNGNHARNVLIGFVEGCLDNVIDYAITQKDFSTLHPESFVWRWGDIEKFDSVGLTKQIDFVKLAKRIDPNCDDVI